MTAVAAARVLSGVWATLAALLRVLAATCGARFLFRTRIAVQAQRLRRLVSGDGDHFQRVLEDLLDVAQQAGFVVANQRDGQAAGAGAAGAADAVHVVFGDHRQRSEERRVGKDWSVRSGTD